MNIIKTCWNWLVYSSANPEKISLTLKAIVPMLVFLGIGDADIFSGVIETSVHFISLTVGYVSAGIATYGALRKLFYTVVSTRKIV